MPINQAGFRKNRSTTEILVKLSTNIKRQFARRKCVLATFFDIHKAYDQVWHFQLLKKLKDIGLSGNIYSYIECFLQNRLIQTRIGKTYSTTRNLSMGIPQGSVIAPFLFTILMYDLPNKISNNVVLVQYADDICIWKEVTLKKKTSQRSINFTKKIYQCELDSISEYMKHNGLSLSIEKTNMILFNSGSNPEKMPTFTVGNTPIKYVTQVKFLGVLFTSKLSWNKHIDNLLTKARKTLNLIKIISQQKWGKDSSTLVNLCKSLMRSKLSYAQEIFFCAPKYLLKKCKALNVRH